MENIDIKALFKKYLDGKATDKERAIVENFCLEKGDHHLTDLTEEEFKEDLLMIWQALRLRRTVKILWWPRVAAAAAILILFIGAYFAWRNIQENQRKDVLAVVHMPMNEKQHIKLSDNSDVWINSGSSFTYPKSFNGKKREVFLSGEAYFDIHHDISKPFIIHTGNVTTTVLGTAFNIREDKKLHTVIVTVTRGKVSVSNGEHTLGVLIRNQQLSFNLNTHQLVQEQVDAQKAIAWEKFDLQFNDITFGEAAILLEKRFNVKITFTNEKIKNCRFTGASFTGEKLDDVLKVLCSFNGAAFQTKPDGSITIDGPGCDKP